MRLHMHMFKNKKKGADYITTGDSSKMKIRQGYNEVENKFYVQIQEIETERSLRIYLDEGFFLSLANGMIKTHDLTVKADLPSDKAV